jgi:hypothetical protein
MIAWVDGNQHLYNRNHHLFSDQNFCESPKSSPYKVLRLSRYTFIDRTAVSFISSWKYLILPVFGFIYRHDSDSCLLWASKWALYNRVFCVLLKWMCMPCKDRLNCQLVCHVCVSHIFYHNYLSLTFKNISIFSARNAFLRSIW